MAAQGERISFQSSSNSHLNWRRWSFKAGDNRRLLGECILHKPGDVITIMTLPPTPLWGVFLYKDVFLCFLKIHEIFLTHILREPGRSLLFFFLCTWCSCCRCLSRCGTFPVIWRRQEGFWEGFSNEMLLEAAAGVLWVQNFFKVFSFKMWFHLFQNKV